WPSLLGTSSCRRTNRASLKTVSYLPATRPPSTSGDGRASARCLACLAVESAYNILLEQSSPHSLHYCVLWKYVNNRPKGGYQTWSVRWGGGRAEYAEDVMALGAGKLNRHPHSIV